MELTTKIEKQEELTPEQENIVRQALRLASLNKKDGHKKQGSN